MHALRQAAGGARHLVALLGGPAGSEATEHAAAALGNLAAGSQAVKTMLRQVWLHGTMQDPDLQRGRGLDWRPHDRVRFV